MIDRLKIKDLSIGKGKPFGADDYFSFSILTLMIAMFIYHRWLGYRTYTFENLENVNVYNALKPSEVNKIYEENQISPAEMAIIQSKEHQVYKDSKLQEEILNRSTSSLAFGTINDVPRVDIRQRFNTSVKKS